MSVTHLPTVADLPPSQVEESALASSRRRRRSLLATAIMAVIVLVPSLIGFGGKFVEFIALYRGDLDGVFAISPIINYLLASTGFFCLFGWAMLGGMFHDIEAPKVTMLETEDWLDSQLEARTQQHG